MIRSFRFSSCVKKAILYDLHDNCGQLHELIQRVVIFCVCCDNVNIIALFIFELKSLTSDDAQLWRLLCKKWSFLQILCKWKYDIGITAEKDNNKEIWFCYCLDLIESNWNVDVKDIYHNLHRLTWVLTLFSRGISTYMHLIRFDEKYFTFIKGQNF